MTKRDDHRRALIAESKRLEAEAARITRRLLEIHNAFADLLRRSAKMDELRRKRGRSPGRKA